MRLDERCFVYAVMVTTATSVPLGFGSFVLQPTNLTKSKSLCVSNPYMGTIYFVHALVSAIEPNRTNNNQSNKNRIRSYLKQQTHQTNYTSEALFSLVENELPIFVIKRRPAIRLNATFPLDCGYKVATCTNDFQLDSRSDVCTCVVSRSTNFRCQQKLRFNEST